MSYFEKDPHVLAAVNMPGLHGVLQQANLCLEKIMRGLNVYLEKKRKFFPRYQSTTSYVKCADDNRMRGRQIRCFPERIDEHSLTKICLM